MNLAARVQVVHPNYAGKTTVILCEFYEVRVSFSCEYLQSLA